MIVKVLGGIDIVSGIAFLMIIFGYNLSIQFVLFCAGLLFLKGLFIIMGDILSAIDLFAASILFLYIFITLPVILIWIPTFFLIAKGFASFL